MKRTDELRPRFVSDRPLDAAAADAAVIPGTMSQEIDDQRIDVFLLPGSAVARLADLDDDRFAARQFDNRLRH